ncbi:MAG TPA: cobalt-precorrin-6A reductase [Gemmatimonadales bacterium]|nr:cobalt-precorrin-6A reductase [Gemmatimonadales bacterium]
MILGGTAEARQLASILTTAGHDVVSSLAGRVHNPFLPPGRVRVGGFGGVDGLISYLRTSGISTVVDATHPFAVQMSSHAAAAADLTGIPLVRLERPGWSNHSRADSWSWVPDAAAARAAAERASRPFLTSGRQSLQAFQSWVDRPVLARVVDRPEIPLPPNWTLLTSRGPYSYAGERQIMIDHSIDLLITKDSGGSYTAAKLDAAHDLDIEVVIIARPTRPKTARVENIEQAMAWLRRSDEATMPRTS